MFSLLGQLLPQVELELRIVFLRFGDLCGQFFDFFIVTVGGCVLNQGFDQSVRIGGGFQLGFDLLDHLRQLS